MSRYDDQKCDGCGMQFQPEEDIVVCPVCGTPQHRECWKNANGCVNDARHGEGFEWKPDEKSTDSAEQNDSDKKITCPHCGEKLVPGLLFCTKCGQPLGENAQQNNNAQFGQNPFGAADPQSGFPPFAIPFYDPFGGVKPDEKIDEVSVRDIVETVQMNSSFYLPKFKAMSGGKKKISWNWGAFFFQHLWFFYRKNYLFGLIYALVNILLQVIFLDPLQKSSELLALLSSEESTMAEMTTAIQGIMPQLMLAAGISFVIRILFTMFSNYIYRCRVFKVVEEAKEKADDEELYHLTLRLKGGASFINGALAYMGTSMLGELLFIFSQMLF